MLLAYVPTFRREVKDLATRVQQDHPTLAELINNAGWMHAPYLTGIPFDWHQWQSRLDDWQILPFSLVGVLHLNWDCPSSL